MAESGLRRSLQGAVFVLIIAVTSVLSCTFFLTPGLLALPFSLALYRSCNEYAVSLWYGLMVSVIELVFRVKVKISGHHRPISGPCIIILNHRTRFDWMYLWCYLFRLGDITKLKIILKSSIRKIPIYGWGLQAVQFLFISRKWSSDEKHIRETMAYFTSHNNPIQLLIFPEGTDLSESNKLKSQQFAGKNGLPRYEYVLNPKTKGFVHCLQELRKGKTQPPVLNLSVGYVGSIAQNEKDIAAGRWPTELHFHGHLLAPSELPMDDVGLEEWLKERWQEKERQLERFYARGQFEGPYLGDEKVYHPTIVARMVVLLLFWLLLAAVFVYCLFLPIFWWYAFVLITFLCSINYFTNGMDGLILRYDRWLLGRT